MVANVWESLGAVKWVAAIALLLMTAVNVAMYTFAETGRMRQLEEENEALLAENDRLARLVVQQQEDLVKLAAQKSETDTDDERQDEEPASCATAVPQPCLPPDDNVTVFDRVKTGQRDKPDLCIAALSSRRYDLLERTLLSTLRHLNGSEPSIRYELVVFDNGQNRNASDYFRRNFVERFRIDKWAVSEVNRGVAYGLNLLFHGLCRAPLVLSLEDDWEFEPTTRPLVQQAISVVRSDPEVIGVYIKYPPGNTWAQEDVFGKTPDGVSYRKVRGATMFKYANGGTLLNRDLLTRVGLQTEGSSRENDGENNYKGRVATLKLTMAAVVDGQRGVYAMQHIGGGRHADRNRRRLAAA